MISSFLTKLLTARQASFTEEEIEIFDLNYAMQPMESLVDLQGIVKKPEAMKEFGRSMSSSFTGHLKKKFSLEEKNVASIWTSIFNISGFGKLEIVRMDGKGGVVEIKGNNFARIYKMKNGKQKQPVCHVISGIIEGVFENVTKRKVSCTERSCAARGDVSCIFEVK
ncbi:hypothetical protein A3K63_01960 [Candidatus Micrarchaeota archaeon RBG_16_49_10]|nr:MAG: hypothetical protein A3K63_01960 [Candidatus Micrarchaeota archaeon RBG_16_49_10]